MQWNCTFSLNLQIVLKHIFNRTPNPKQQVQEDREIIEQIWVETNDNKLSRNDQPTWLLSIHVLPGEELAPF